MIAEWLIIGSIPFYVATVLALVVITAAIENEKGLAATVCLGVYLALIHTFGDANLIASVTGNLPLVFGAIPLYFVAGGAWGIAKWFFYTRKIAADMEDKYLSAKTSFLNLHHLPSNDPTLAIPESHATQWKDFAARNTIFVKTLSLDGSHIQMDQVATSVPQARTHKARITTWMMFWPTSLAWTIVNDPIRAICQHVYTGIQQWLQSISNAAFARVNNLAASDFKKPDALANATPVDALDSGVTSSKKPVVK